MSDKFAFDVSLVDLIRKTQFRFASPMDYVDMILGKMYRPGREVDVVTDDGGITVRWTGEFNPRFVEDVERKNVLRLAELFPPREYERVEMQLDGRRIVVDAERDILVERFPGSESGAISIVRHPNGEDEYRHLRRKFAASDMLLNVNGMSISVPRDHWFAFQDESTVRGSMNYNAQSTLGLHFFCDGRYVTGEPLVRGVNVRLYEHGLPVTIASSNVARHGTASGQYRKIVDTILPDVFLSYLRSPLVERMERKSPVAYQAMLRTISRRYGNHEPIRAYLQQHLKIQNPSRRMHRGHTLEQIANQQEVAVSPADRELIEQSAGERQAVDSPASSTFQRLVVPGFVLMAFLLIAGGLAVGWSHGESAEPVPGVSPSGEISVASEAASPAKRSAFERREAQQRNALDERERVTRASDRKVVLSYQPDVHRAADFPSRESLVRRLNRVRDAESPTYVRADVSNALRYDGRRYIWYDSEPLDRLQIKTGRLTIPAELKQRIDCHLSREARLRLVQRYIQTEFTYGPNERTEPNTDPLLSAVERKMAICDSANTYVAILLFQLGERQVRCATGRLGNMPHMWLEYRTDDENWIRLDCTPTRLDPTLRDELARNPRRVTPITLQHDKYSGPTLISKEASFYRQRPSGRVFIALGVLVILIAAAFWSSHQARHSDSRFTMWLNAPSEPNRKELACLIIRDSLGVKHVQTSDCGEIIYDRQSKTLTVPESQLGNGTTIQLIVSIAQRLSPELRREGFRSIGEAIQ